MIAQLDRLINDVEEFPRWNADFKILIGGLSDWLMLARDMPLVLDKFYFVSPGDDMPRQKDSFIDRIIHEVVSLFYSFIIDYTAIGDVSERGDERTIIVWIGGGRDQANSLKSLINESFTRNTGIRVNLMLVDMGPLLQATLSGQGPDVAMMVDNALPMNFAYRGAATNLRDFDGFDEVRDRFRDSAMIPFEYDGNTYALPDTQSFPLLFYRKDLLAELGLSVPETWDDVIASLPLLNKEYMEFGFGATDALMGNADVAFAMLLYQFGGQLYSDCMHVSAVDSDEAVRAFRFWTQFYTEYRVPQQYNFPTRFRNGEMPMGIEDFQTYNLLTVSAPEIRGLWGFAPVPGTIQPDGTINRSITSGGSATIIMHNARDKEASWEFIKWWTDANTQIQYAREMEALMGPAARFPTANLEAFQMLPWPIQDLRVIMEQGEYVVGVPRVPGGYYAPRQIANAFYSVVVATNMEPRDALTYYIRFLDDEIAFKRWEFRLDMECTIEDCYCRSKK
jgi:ABC-type glycerol-3-phosphate transport system substrate-binding protein